MKKTYLFTLLAMIASFASFALGSISGPTTTCSGNIVYFSDVDSGGSWSSSNAAIATINAYGQAIAISAGSTTITYTLGGSFVTAPLTVYASPAPIAESATSFCSGTLETCTDAIPGGTWSSGSGVSITSAGVVTGVAPGVTYINYSISGCSVTIYDTVTTTYSGSLSGPGYICTGATGSVTFSGVGSGGSWSSSTPAVATVNSSGVVTGISSGRDTIRYTVSGTCDAGSSMIIINVTGTTAPGYIYTAGGTVNVGGAITLTDYDASATGTWSSSNPSVASIDPLSGIATGIAAGAVTITYSVVGCSGPASAVATLTVVPFSTSLVGPDSGCTGSSFYFSDSLYSGGTWSSSNPAVASIDAYGDLTAISAGITTITYNYSGSIQTLVFTVNPSPLPITETSTSFCIGSTAICTDATAGGSWSASSSYIASVSATGVVTGLNGGGTYIYYTLPDGCSTYIYNSVNTTDAGHLHGLTNICAGSTTIISVDSTTLTSGTWSTSNPAIATVDASGTVTGLSAGIDTIRYAAAGSCGTGYATIVITVSNTTNAGTSYEDGTLYTGSTANMYNYGASATGTWSSSDPSIASINPASGLITGITAGTVTVAYTVDGCGGVATSTVAVTVSALNGISGNVNFGGTPYYGNVTVWLITYNPTTHDLEATDSVTVYSSGSSAYYQFTGLATDSFRVKAAAGNDSSYIDTGYVPTYHTSSCYWSAANVIYHTAGTSDINEDINMAFGSVSAGPGFIGGNVTTGANRGTSAGIPAVGLLIFAVNTTTNTLTQQTYTDGSGNYSFSNLPVGTTYMIYPEAINYGTNAYTHITLTSAAPTMSAASFIQHTVSHTITPILEAVNNVAPAVSSVITYPNPVSGDLNIQWQENGPEKGMAIISDISGREIIKTVLNMNQGSGKAQLDLSGLSNGLYIITVKSPSINYNSKIQVQH